MKHLKKGRKLHRKRDQRRALIKSLVHNLILKERIKTTLAKAKEAQKKIERLITIAKKRDLTAYRRLKAELPQKSLNKLYYEIAPLYKERKGGCTRIIKTMLWKKGDGSELVILELIK